MRMFAEARGARLWTSRAAARGGFSRRALLFKTSEMMSRLSLPAPAVFDLRLCDSREMRQFNREDRGIDAATDSLAYMALDFDSPLVLCNEAGVLAHYADGEIDIGDVYLAPDYVAGKLVGRSTLQRRLEELTSHAICHLVGFSHDDDEQHTSMCEFERMLLGRPWDEDE